MNIKTQAEADALNARIKRELGVDVSRYRNQEVVETLGSLLVFPVYALNWVARPIGVLFVAWLVGFFLLDLVHIQYLIYGIFGLVLALLTGLVAGIYYLTIRFRGDVYDILNYSMDILKSIVQDLDQLNDGTNAGNRKENLTLLFGGVVHIITVPVAASVITGRIPFVGGLLAGIFTRVLRRLANLFKWPEVAENHATVTADGDAGNILPIYLAGVTNFQSYTGKIISVAIRIVQFPIRLLFFLFTGLSILFLYLIH